ncbi:MAG: indolepyruvate oxidoreductase subunit beta [Myxococcus sp.]|nr:indolepyruvate oxidoreductase subunit beta [Myxococcus sp.]
MNFDLVLCGVGGQGVLSTAYVIDHAAVDAGLHFKQPEIHGMSQRGGAVSAQVRLGSAPIASDLISAGEARAVLSVEPLESLRYLSLLSKDGWVFTDVTPLKNMADYPDTAKLYEVLFSLPRVVAVNATRLAARAGASKAQNMVVLGAAASLLPFAVELLEKHLRALFQVKGEHVVKANLKAFQMGLSARAFKAALVERGVPAAVAARVVARLDFDPAPVPEAVVNAWVARLTRADGEALSKRLLASGDALPLDAQVPAALASSP